MGGLLTDPSRAQALLVAVLFYGGLLAVAGYDLRTRRVPNALSVGLLLLGLLARGGFEGWAGLSQGLGGAAVGFALVLPAFVLRLVGGADVKVMAAIGAFLCPAGALWAAGLGFIAGGVLALGVMLKRGALRREVLRNLRGALLEQRLPAVGGRARFDSVPHVTAYAIGGALTRWMHWGC